MKSLKALGLASLIAAAVMAVIASSAMAQGTGFCSTEDCEALVTHVHETSVEPGLLLSEIVGSIECDVLFLGSATEGTPLEIEGSYTYSSCETEGGGSCTTTELSGPAVISVLRTGHETAEVEIEDERLVKCGLFLHCVYSSLGMEGTRKGPLLASQENGEVSFQNQEVTKVSGFLCPEVSELDLITTPLTPVYVTSLMSCVRVSANDGLWGSKNGNTCEGYLGGKREYLLQPPGV